MDRKELNWQVTSFSGPGGSCVEVAKNGGAVHVRNSNDPGGPMATFTMEEWSKFRRGIVERNEFAF